jgi:hypothetical protein
MFNQAQTVVIVKYHNILLEKSNMDIFCTLIFVRDSNNICLNFVLFLYSLFKFPLLQTGS